MMTASSETVTWVVFEKEGFASCGSVMVICFGVGVSIESGLAHKRKRLEYSMEEYEERVPPILHHLPSVLDEAPEEPEVLLSRW